MNSFQFLSKLLKHFNQSNLISLKYSDRYQTFKFKKAIPVKEKEKSNIEESILENENNNLHSIYSHSIGILYYHRILNIGEALTKGQEIAYIDVLGSSIYIFAETDIKIKKIYLENQSSVEYGQKILDVENL